MLVDVAELDHDCGHGMRLRENGGMRTALATPARKAMAAGIVLCLIALAWYLGSPFFIRTTINEAAPLVAPAGQAISSATGGVAPLVATPAGPVTLAQGELGFVDAIHNGKGAVLLIRTADATVLRFENVTITNAPDIHVYLSREVGGKWTESSSLYVGALKATNGSFNYTLPAGTDLSSYRSAVVWCRQFAVLITWADLKELR
jgi:hypothetical protein